MLSQVHANIHVRTCAALLPGTPRISPPWLRSRMHRGSKALFPGERRKPNSPARLVDLPHTHDTINTCYTAALPSVNHLGWTVSTASCVAAGVWPRARGMVWRWGCAGHQSGKHIIHAGCMVGGTCMYKARHFLHTHPFRFVYHILPVMRSSPSCCPASLTHVLRMTNHHGLLAALLQKTGRFVIRNASKAPNVRLVSDTRARACT